MPSTGKRATPSRDDENTPFSIGGEVIEPGQRRRIEIPIARLPSETWLSLTLEVINGRDPGPRLWLCAALHGDEINGIEIVRQVMEQLDPMRLHGTAVAVPVVNVFGFINQSRYLPDRRDLNRCFPGSPRGSLGARLAHMFMELVVKQCSHGIDLHTASNHRTNLPQIRANLQDDETQGCAEAFGAPVIIDSQIRDGSLRHAAAKLGIPVLVYEAGEPLRFDAESIRLGVEGVLRVMAHLGMRRGIARAHDGNSLVASGSSWIRAPRSGVLHLQTALGSHVIKKQPLADIRDAFGDDSVSVRAPSSGVVIGHTNNPLVNQGDAIIHLADVDNR